MPKAGVPVFGQRAAVVGIGAMTTEDFGVGESRNGRDWWIAALVVGFCSLLAQLVGLREFVAAWAGNELVIGIYLGCAMLLTAAGASSWSLRRTRATTVEVAWLLAASGPLPALQVLLIRTLRGAMSPLAMPDVAAVSLLAVVVLAPVSLVFGFAFARVADRAAADGAAGRAYVAETAGAVIAGILYTVSAASSVPAFSVALVCLAVGGGAGAALLLGQRRRPSGMAIGACTLLLLAGGIHWNPARLALRAWFPGQTVIAEVDGPYGNLVLTRAGRQLSLFRDGVPISSSSDPRQAEEAVHFAMVQRPHPRRILMLGGLAIGAEREVLKYPVEAVDAVEFDRSLVGLAQRLHERTAPSETGTSRAGSGTLKARDISVRIDDPRRFVRRRSGAYDVVVIAAADPSTAAGARFYTKEFFEDVARVMSDDGVVSISIVGSANYRSAAERALLRGVRATLSSVFAHVVALPSARVVFLASSGPLVTDVAAAIAHRGIDVSFVDRAYMAADLSAERVAELERDLAGPGTINRDHRPTIYRLYLQRWLTEFGGSTLWPATAFSLVLALILRRSLTGGAIAVRSAIAASGFASLTLEVCLLLAFQMTSGGLFLEIGLLLAAFMVGGTAGAHRGARRRERPERRLVRADVALAFAAVAIGLTLAQARASSSVWTVGGYAGALALLGFLTGMEMPLALETLSRPRRARTQESVSVNAGLLAELYGADLAGAALGAMTAAVILVPALGIARTCLTVAVVKVLTASTLALGSGRAVAYAGLRRREVPVGFFSVSLLMAVVVLVAAPQTRLSVYAVSFSGGYHALLLGLLTIGLAATLVLRPTFGGAGRLLRKTLTTLRSESVRLVHNTAFSLATFYPLARCYFQVPYVFCHVCPRVCVFGYLRPYWVPAALLMNLGSYSWCRRMCPLGAAYEPSRGGRTPGRRLLRVAAAFRLIVLVGVAWAYFAMAGAVSDENPTSSNLYSVLFKNGFTVSTAVLAVMGVLWWLGRWVPRSFCNLLCPVGAACDLANTALRRAPAGVAEDRDDHGC